MKVLRRKTVWTGLLLAGLGLLWGIARAHMVENPDASSVSALSTVRWDLQHSTQADGCSVVVAVDSSFAYEVPNPEGAKVNIGVPLEVEQDINAARQWMQYGVQPEQSSGSVIHHSHGGNSNVQIR